MAELKTKQTDDPVDAFIDTIEDSTIRTDCKRLMSMMRKATKSEAKMWGTSIVGFGKYHYKSEKSSQQGEWFLVGFSPRKQNISIYLMAGFENFDELMRDLGKYKTGKGCLYVRRLGEIDTSILETLIKESVAIMKTRYAT